MTNIDLLPKQLEMIRATEKFVWLRCGIGYGKTFVLGCCLIDYISKYPNATVLVTASTYNQLLTATVKEIINVLEIAGIDFKAVLGGTNKTIKIGNFTILLRSLENFDKIRGITVDALFCDEICYSKKEAFDVIIGRLRGKNGDLRVRFFSTPNGFDWTYNLFQGSEDKRMIVAPTQENFFLDKQYYETLLELYGGLDSPHAKQELSAEFVNLNSGAAYWAFDRENVVSDCKLNINYPIYVGQDFNAKHMCGVYIQYIKDKFYITKENVLTGEHANTFSTADHIVRDAAQMRVHMKIVPDSTGKATKSSSNKTDHQILRDAGLEVLPTHNPLIKDRWNSVNLAFKRGDIVIDSSCKELIKELETLSVDDKEGDVSHLAVALGYVIYKLKPIKPPKQTNQPTHWR